jgi:hypothetical protein
MLDIDIEQINSPSGRTFQPDRNDKSGRTALRVANAPAGATYRWTTQPEAVQFIAPNAPATSMLAGRPGVRTVSVEVRDPKTCPGEKPHPRFGGRARLTPLASTCGPSRLRKGRRGATVALSGPTDGEGHKTTGISWPSWRATAVLRLRADNGDEVRRPAGSQRCARPWASACLVGRGCCCGGPDAGGWRCSTRGNGGAGVGGAVR